MAIVRRVRGVGVDSAICRISSVGRCARAMMKRYLGVDGGLRF